ncbi:MAG: hypothetical protein ACMG50_03780, partial [Thermomonas sp.]
EETARPSYQRGTPRKVATIALSKAQLNIPPPPAVTKVKPAQPAPLRDPKPMPEEQARPVAVIEAAATPVLASGVIGWLRGLFIGAPVAASTEPTVPSDADGARRDGRGGNRSSGRNDRDGRGNRDQRGNRDGNRRGGQDESRGNKQTDSQKQGEQQKQAQPEARQPKQPRNEKQQTAKQDKQDKPQAQPQQQKQPKQERPKQERQERAEKAKSENGVAVVPLIAASAIVVANEVTPSVPTHQPLEDLQTSQVDATEGDSTHQDDSNSEGDGGSKRRRGRRGGRRRRRGGDAAGNAGETPHDQDSQSDEMLNADGSQPEFDFDDIEAPVAKPVRMERAQADVTPVAVAPATPSPAVAPDATDVQVAPVVVEAVAQVVEVETFATPVAAAVETSIEMAPIEANPVVIEQASPQSLIEQATPVADAAENVVPEAIVVLPLASVAVQEQAIEPALTMPEPMTVEATQAVDANSRAEQLRGLFDTARANTEQVDTPVSANSADQIEPVEETRNA